MPNLATVSGRITTPGSNAIIANPSGSRIKVVSYDLQSEGDCARGYFASGPSGSQLTPQWELGNREGVCKQIPEANGAYVFAANLGDTLSFESSSTIPMKYSVTYHSDDNF